MANSNSPSEASFGAAPYETTSNNQTTQAPTKPKSKPRKRVNTAEKRHQHNAIERQRRETLNGKFLGLARLLPSLASHRRPSKSAIVNGSISHLNLQREQRLLASKLLRQLCAERDQLAKECNEWRSLNGRPSREASSAWTPEMEQVCEVEKEVFGNFQTMDEGDEDDQDGSNGNESFSFAAGLVNPATGLITPRSSTDIDPLSIGLTIQPQQTRLIHPPPQATLTNNWANDFTFNPSTLANAASLPFSAFMTDGSNGLESLCDSPTNSQHTGIGSIPTPPTSADFVGFTHTPSPRSSNSFNTQVNECVDKPWTEEQMLFLQSVQQQQLQQRQALQQHQQQQQQNMASMLFDNVSAWNTSATDSNQFTQNLLASMFPQQSNVHVGNRNNSMNALNQLPQQPPQVPTLSRAQTENMEAWRKLASGSVNRGNAQPTVAELKNAIRAGMGIGMNLGNGLWESNSVKGY